MTESNKRIKLSIEPIQLPSSLLPSTSSNSIFDSPIKLLDVNLNDSVEIFTRETEKPLGERLKRVWTERVEFAGRTPLIEQEEDEVTTKDELDKRPNAAEMKTLQEQLMQQLDLARTELTTALDLLSVLSPITNPPTVDPLSLPLPAETLSLIRTIKPKPKDSSEEEVESTKLGLAISLDSIKRSANSFFTASELLLGPSTSTSSSAIASTSTLSSAKPSDSFPLLLSLLSSSTSSHSFVPLGARPGANLTKGAGGSTKLARTVGIFFGCQEASEIWRRSSVATVRDIREIVLGDKGKGKEESKKRQGGRKMMITIVRSGGEEERAIWDDEEEELENEGVEGDQEQGSDSELKAVEKELRRRGRSIFAEELFAVLSNEARLDNTLKAKLVLGKKSIGDSVVTEGHEWSFTVTMVHNPPTPTASSSSTSLPLTLLSLLRLLFLQEYSHRRRISNSTSSSSNAVPPSSSSSSTLTTSNSQIWTKPLLATLAVFLSHKYRLKTLIQSMEKLKEELSKSVGLGEEKNELNIYGQGNCVRFFNSGGVGGEGAREDEGEMVMRILKGEKEIGGRLVFRVDGNDGLNKTFHISHSLLLPSNPALANQNPTIPHQTLVLQSPLGPPVPVPSFTHLELFLREQLKQEFERDSS